jgi:hypothetical protein
MGDARQIVVATETLTPNSLGRWAFAFAGVFDLRRMRGIDIVPALTLLLFAHAPCQRQ